MIYVMYFNNPMSGNHETKIECWDIYGWDTLTEAQTLKIITLLKSLKYAIM